jgi:hypothetical protein
MELIATLKSPLKVFTPRKTMEDRGFILNLNVYSATHRFTTNAAKKVYKEFMAEQIGKLPDLSKVAVRFTLYPKSRHLIDTPNVCCIHDKFFMDALVELGKLPEDNYIYYVETAYRCGGIDKADPRVDIEIYEK